MEIRCFDDFCAELRESGFSLAGKDKGIFSLLTYDWSDQPENAVIRWHTGDKDTDPWEWRMRVLYDCDDIAYAKLFFGTGGYITKEWYPYFWAVRRHGVSFEEAYENGTISAIAKRIYDIIEKNGSIAMHELKQLAGITKEEASKYDRALVELQSKMFITLCGQTRKKNSIGMGYGWNSTMFTTVESFWESRGCEIEDIDPHEALDALRAQVLKLNPAAEARRIDKFIKG